VQNLKGVGVDERLLQGVEKLSSVSSLQLVIEAGATTYYIQILLRILSAFSQQIQCRLGKLYFQPPCYIRNFYNNRVTQKKRASPKLE